MWERRCVDQPEVGLPCEFTGAWQEMYALARSVHTGGVQVVFGDGHVSFVSDGIDLFPWQALSTIAGGDFGDES